MRKKTGYADEPLKFGKRVKDFLPPPSELVRRGQTEQVTLELSRSSLDFFRKRARRGGVPFRRMLSGLIDAYARKHDSA